MLALPYFAPMKPNMGGLGARLYPTLGLPMLFWYPQKRPGGPQNHPLEQPRNRTEVPKRSPGAVPADLLQGKVGQTT